LEESKVQEGVDLAALNDEFVEYFAARQRYDALERRARHDFSHAAELYDEARTVMEELLDKLRLPQVRKLAENRFSQYETYRNYALENASRFGKLIGQSSHEWQTTDLNGNARTLQDYRGKVVLLDFWYRGCGWCIRAMPQLNQLAGDFSGQPVAVLGMNNDSKKADADFVIETMKLEYPTLKNRADGSEGDAGIHANYEISGWPTLVVLDGKGVIRHIHVGYSDKLHEDLGQVIRELLAEQNAAAAN
jgi:thiol-disulfide isomerase/thioredoxin